MAGVSLSSDELELIKFLEDQIHELQPLVNSYFPNEEVEAVNIAPVDIVAKEEFGLSIADPLGLDILEREKVADDGYSSIDEQLIITQEVILQLRMAVNPEVHRSLFSDELELIEFLLDQIRYLQPLVDGCLPDDEVLPLVSVVASPLFVLIQDGLGCLIANSEDDGLEGRRPRFYEYFPLHPLTDGGGPIACSSAGNNKASDVLY